MISPFFRLCRELVGQLGLICAVSGFMVSTPTMAFAQSNAVLQQALKHLEAEQYQQAQPLLERLAGEGDAVAAYNLGLMAEFGLGQSVDYEQAFTLYQQAESQNLPQAQFTLAMLYLEGKTSQGVQYEAGKELIQQAAEQGYVPAFSVLSMIELSGLTGDADLLQAHLWVCKAVAKGDTPSFADLISKRLSEEDRQC